MDNQLKLGNVYDALRRILMLDEILKFDTLICFQIPSEPSGESVGTVAAKPFGL
jgi:hypothetical protein